MLSGLKKHVKPIIAIAGATLLYVLLSLHDITTASIWFDEAYSAWIVGHDPMTLLSITAQDIHPPLYYLILQTWSLLFGLSEFSLRFLSTLLGAMVVITSYGVARHVMQQKYAWLVPYFIAISPMLVRYGREARMYTLLTLLIILSLYLIIKAVSQPERRLWRLHGIVIGLGILTHYLMPIYWLAQWLWLSIRAYQSGERRFRFIVVPPHWKTSLLSTLVVVILWVPIILITAVVKQVVGFWIPPVTFEILGNTVTRMFTYEPITDLLWWQLVLVGVFSVAAITLSIYVVRKRLVGSRKNFVLLVMSVLTPPALLVILSLPPMVSKYYDRYLTSSMVVGALVIGIICVTLLHHHQRVMRIVAVGFTVLYVALSVVGIISVYNRGNYNEFDGTTTVKQLMGDIERVDNESPVYVMNPGVAVSVSYYAQRANLTVIEMQEDYSYVEDDVIRMMKSVPSKTDLWLIDNVRIPKGSNRPIVWKLIPNNWQQQDVIEYDYSPEEPSYRAVRYIVE